MKQIYQHTSDYNETGWHLKCSVRHSDATIKSNKFGCFPFHSKPGMYSIIATKKKSIQIYTSRIFSVLLKEHLEQTRMWIDGTRYGMCYHMQIISVFETLAQKVSFYMVISEGLNVPEYIKILWCIHENIYTYINLYLYRQQFAVLYICWRHTILNPAQRWDVVWNGGAVGVLWWGGQGTHIIIVAAIASKCSLLWFILWRVMCALCRFEWLSLQMHADRLTAFICNRAFSAYEGDVGLEGGGDSVDEVFGKCVHALSQCWHATKYNLAVTHLMQVVSQFSKCWVGDFWSIYIYGELLRVHHVHHMCFPSHTMWLAFV